MHRFRTLIGATAFRRHSAGIVLAAPVLHSAVKPRGAERIFLRSNARPFAPAHTASTVLNHGGLCLLHRDQFDTIRRTRHAKRSGRHSVTETEQSGCLETQRFAVGLEVAVCTR